MGIIHIGTRGSPLALWQANWVRDRIEKNNRDVSVSIKVIQTKGDKILDTPLAMVGGKGLFVKEIETELISGGVDIAVHSMKDVPTVLPDKLEISVVCKREDPRDALIAQKAESFDRLPHGAKLGTSSLRRSTQILNKRPDIKIVPLRGNIGTRIRKLTEENLDAIMLAAAGLKRMEQDNLVTQYLSVEESLPAVAQGALGIETRKGDDATLSLIGFLNHDETRIAIESERAALTRLEGGCQVPIAAHAEVTRGIVRLDGLVGAVDGSVLYRDKMEAPIGEHKKLGVELAERLLQMGAGEILKEAYGN